MIASQLGVGECERRHGGWSQLRQMAIIGREREAFNAYIIRLQEPGLSRSVVLPIDVYMKLTSILKAK